MKKIFIWNIVLVLCALKRGKLLCVLKRGEGMYHTCICFNFVDLKRVYIGNCRQWRNEGFNSLRLIIFTVKKEYIGHINIIVVPLQIRTINSVEYNELIFF